jgi:predicted secreted protein
MEAAQTITEEGDGRNIALHVGERVVICLDENPGTGYRWVLDAPMTKLSIVDSRFTASSASLGSGGQQCWTLQANAPGEEAVQFRLGRSWEGDAAALRRFSFTASIAAS